jgi:hypothetical protein
MLVKFCAPERGSTPRRGREAGAPRRGVRRSLFLSCSLTGGLVGSLWPAVSYLRVRRGCVGWAHHFRNTFASTPSHHPAQHLIPPPRAPNPNLSPFPVGRRLLPPRACFPPPRRLRCHLLSSSVAAPAAHHARIHPEGGRGVSRGGASYRSRPATA